MSIELPWSTRVFITAKFSISMVMTMESSWARSMPLKSASVNVMEGIVLHNGIVTTFTTCTALKCFLLAVVHFPPTNPPAMVLITPLRDRFWGRCYVLSLARCRRSGLSSPLVLSWPSWGVCFLELALFV